jgi:hypothetical protein
VAIATHLVPRVILILHVFFFCSFFFLKIFFSTKVVYYFFIFYIFLFYYFFFLICMIFILFRGARGVSVPKTFFPLKLFSASREYVTCTSLGWTPLRIYVTRPGSLDNQATCNPSHVVFTVSRCRGKLSHHQAIECLALDGELCRHCLESHREPQPKG